MLDVARCQLEDDGYDVCGAYVTPMMSVGSKPGLVEPLQRWRTRATICHLLLSDHEFGMLDAVCLPFSNDFQRHHVHSLAGRLRASTNFKGSVGQTRRQHHIGVFIFSLSLSLSLQFGSTVPMLDIRTN